MSHVIVQTVIELVGIRSREQFRLQCLSEQRERCVERTASDKLFQTEVAAAKEHLPPMMARQVREVTRAVEDREQSR